MPFVLVNLLALKHHDDVEHVVQYLHMLWLPCFHFGSHAATIQESSQTNESSLYGMKEVCRPLWNKCRKRHCSLQCLSLSRRTNGITVNVCQEVMHLVFKCLNIIQKEMSLKMSLKSKVNAAFCWSLISGILYRQRKIVCNSTSTN